MKSANPIEVAYTYVILASVGIGLIARGFHKFKRSQEVRDAPLAKASSAPQGKAELQGYAWPSEKIRAPVSNLEVVYYNFELFICSNKQWSCHTYKTSIEPFFLVDKTGLVQITPSRADIEFNIDRSHDYEWTSLPPEKRRGLEEFLGEYRINSLKESGVRPAQIKVRESIITCGAKIYALGEFRTTDNADYLKASPTDGVTFFINNLNKNQSAEKQTGGADVKIHGEIVNRRDEKLLVADCWRDKLAYRFGSPFFNYLQIIAGCLIIVLLCTPRSILFRGRRPPGEIGQQMSAEYYKELADEIAQRKISPQLLSDKLGDLAAAKYVDPPAVSQIFEREVAAPSCRPDYIHVLSQYEMLPTPDDILKPILRNPLFLPGNIQCLDTLLKMGLISRSEFESRYHMSLKSQYDLSGVSKSTRRMCSTQYTWYNAIIMFSLDKKKVSVTTIKNGGYVAFDLTSSDSHPDTFKGEGNHTLLIPRGSPANEPFHITLDDESFECL